MTWHEANLQKRILVWPKKDHPRPSYNSKNNKIWVVGIKLDMEKVYNMLKWIFINQTLTNPGFLENLTKTIMACVEFVSFLVLINGTSQIIFTLPEASDRETLFPNICLIIWNFLDNLVFSQKFWKFSVLDTRFFKFSGILSWIFSDF